MKITPMDFYNEFKDTYPKLHAELHKWALIDFTMFDWHTNGKGELEDVCMQDPHGHHVVINVLTVARGTANYMAIIEGWDDEKYTGRGMTRQEAIIALVNKLVTYDWMEEEIGL